FGLVLDRHVEAACDIALGAVAGVLFEIGEDDLAGRRTFGTGVFRAWWPAHASSAVAFVLPLPGAFLAAGLAVFAAALAAGFLVVDVESPVDLAAAFLAGAFAAFFLPFIFVEGAAAARVSTSSIACSSVIEAGSAPRG